MESHLFTEEFINRSQEIAQVEHVLNKLEAASNFVHGIIYTGLIGIGKTRILQHARSLCNQRRLICFVADFQKQPVSSPLEFLSQLLAQLDQLKSPRRAKKSSSLRRYRDATIFIQSQDKVFKTFVSQVKKHSKKRPLSFLMDNCESCPDDVFDWIGQQFLLRLIDLHASPIALFLTSRGPHVAESGWPRKFIDATQLYHVPPFNLESTKKHIAVVDQAGSCRGGEEHLYQLSVGHPYSTQELVFYLHSLNVDATNLPKYHKELAHRLFDEVIHRYVLADISSWEPDIFHLACIPRRFDPVLLEKIHPLYTRHRYGAFLRDLQKPNLYMARADSGRPAYQLESTLRKLLHAAVSIIDSDRVNKWNMQLKQFYEEQLAIEAKTGRPTAASLIELLYHYLQLKVLPNESIVATELVTWFKRQLRAYFRTEQVDDRIELTLLNDLLIHDSELIGLIGKNIINELSSTVESLIKKTATNPLVNNVGIRETEASYYHISWYADDQTVRSTELIHCGIKHTIKQWRERMVETGNDAFTLYLPPRAQRFVREGEQRALCLITDSMQIPFELLHYGADFLCMTRPLSRMVEILPEPRQFAPATDIILRALVIGNPSNDLSDADAEAHAVANLLRGSGVQVDHVTSRLEVALKEFVQLLIRNRYQLIHFAGHGFFESDPRLTGLSFEPPDTLVRKRPTLMIAADELKRYLQAPAFIFFNACWAAASEPEATEINPQGKFIHNLAVAALEGGACGCLGPMWQVDDGSAKDFSIAFYEHLLKRFSTAESVLEARKRIRHQKTDCWASWVLFGEPYMYPLGR